MVSALLMTVLLVAAVALAIGLSALSEFVFESGLLAFDRPYMITWWFVLPTLSLVCLGLGIRWRRRPRRWLLLLASLSPTAWAGLSLYWYRQDSLWWQPLFTVYFGAAVVALLAAVALPTRWRRRSAVALCGLSIPAPLMAFVLVGISFMVLYEALS
jgi:hypothetical protein